MTLSPRKARPNVVCKALGREDSQAVAEILEPLKKYLGKSEGKISRLVF